MFSTDETQVSNGATSMFADLPVQVKTASSRTPSIESQSTISTQVSVLASMDGIEHVVVCNKSGLSRTERAVLTSACPETCTLHFSRQKAMNGELFAELMKLTRTAFVRKADTHDLCARLNIPKEALQTAPLLLYADSPSTHKTRTVKTTACTLTWKYVCILTLKTVAQHVKVIGLLHHTSLWAQAVSKMRNAHSFARTHNSMSTHSVLAG